MWFFNAVFLKLQRLIGIQGTINSISNAASESGARKRALFQPELSKEEIKLAGNRAAAKP